MSNAFLATAAAVALAAQPTTPPPAPTPAVPMVRADIRTGRPLATVTPRGPWNLDYGETECVLTRNFGTEQNLYILRVAQSVAPGVIDITIAGNGLPPIDDPAPRFRVTAGSQTRDVRAYRIALRSDVERFVRFYVPVEFLSELRDPAVTLNVEGRPVAISFASTMLPAAIRSLNTCHESLRTYWSTPRVSADATQRPPAPTDGSTPASPANNQNYWVTAADFSDDEDIGMLVTYLLIGTDGRVANCAVAQALLDASLTARTCLLIRQRARFTPARNAAGEAVRSTYFKRIIFRR